MPIIVSFPTEERVKELQGQLRGAMSELGSIGFPIQAMDTPEQISRITAEQTIIGNRIYKHSTAMAAARAELKLLLEADLPAIPDDAALLHIVMHLTPSSSEPAKMTAARSSFAVWKKLCAEAAAGEI